MDIKEQINNVVSTSPVSTQQEAQKNIKVEQPKVNPENIAPLEPKKLSEEFYDEQGITKESIENYGKKIEEDVALKTTPSAKPVEEKVEVEEQPTEELKPQTIEPQATERQPDVYPIEIDETGYIAFKDRLSTKTRDRFAKVAPYEVTDSNGNILNTDEKDAYKLGFINAMQTYGDNGVNYLGYTPVSPDTDSGAYTKPAIGLRGLDAGILRLGSGFFRLLGQFAPTTEVEEYSFDFNPKITPLSLSMSENYIDPQYTVPFDANGNYRPMPQNVKKRTNWFFRRAEELNRNANDISMNTYEIMNQTLANEVINQVGEGLPQYALIFGATKLNPALGVLSSAMNNLEVYYDVRDNNLETGISKSDASYRALGAFGANTALDVLSALSGNLVTKGVATKIVNKYGFNDLAMKLTVGGTSVAVGGLSEGLTETIQNKFQDYFAGRITPDEFWEFDRTDKVTFLASAILGAMGGAIDAKNNISDIQKDRKKYTDKFNQFITIMTAGAEKLEAAGFGKKEDWINLAKKVWQNKDYDVKQAVDEISQEIEDRLKENLPDDVKELLQNVDAKNVSQDAMRKLDAKIQKQIKSTADAITKLGYKLTPNLENVLKGLYTGYANIVSVFSGIPINEVELPTVIPVYLSHDQGGVYDYISNTIKFNINKDFSDSGTAVQDAFGYAVSKDQRGERGNIDSLIHEFTHAIDEFFLNSGVQISSGKNKVSFTNFFKSYVDLITNTFQEGKEKDPTQTHYILDKNKGVTKAKLGTWIKYIYKTFGTKAKEYTRPFTDETKKSSEYMANAVTMQGKDAASYVGLDDSTVALYTRIANILLNKVNGQTPLNLALTKYLNTLKQMVKENSDIIQKIGAISTPDKWNTAIKAYMAGVQDINWNNITKADIEKLAMALAENDTVNARTLDILEDMFEGIDYKDFIAVATRNFKEGIENATSSKLPKDKKAQAKAIDENNILFASNKQSTSTTQPTDNGVTQTVEVDLTGVNLDDADALLESDMFERALPKDKKAQAKAIDENNTGVNLDDADALLESDMFERAYHTSKKDFDKFKTSEHISEGVGDQVHGYGTYVSKGLKTVNKYHKFFMTQAKQNPLIKAVRPDGTVIAQSEMFGDSTYLLLYGVRNLGVDIMISNTQYDIETATLPEVRKTYEDRLKILQEIKKGGVEIKDTYKLPQTYMLEIPSSQLMINEQLKYDEQPEFVKQQFSELLKDKAFDKYKEEFDNKYRNVNTNNLDWATHEQDNWSGLLLNGREIYINLSVLLGGDKKASELLDKYGIKGIKYKGNRDDDCFVVFNDDDVNIIQKRYNPDGTKNFERAVSDKIEPTDEPEDARTTNLNDSEGVANTLNNSQEQPRRVEQLLNNKMDGHSFRDAFKKVYELVMNSKRLKGITGAIAEYASTQRGLPDYLNLISKELDEYFGLTKKYNKFMELVNTHTTNLYESLLGLFDGESRQIKSFNYNSYISQTGIKNIEISYFDPIGSWKGWKKKMVSKREVMSVWLQYQQKDTNLDARMGKTIQQRLEQTFDMNEIESLLTDFDKKFALKLQEFLKRFKRTGDDKGIINYFPLVDAIHREENDGIDYERGRHSDGPLGCDDALYLVQNYINRESSFISQYGLARRRLKQIFDFSGKDNSLFGQINSLNENEISELDKLSAMSTDMRRQLEKTFRGSTLKAFFGLLNDNRIAYREDVNAGVLGKGARNITKGLLTFKPISFLKNNSNITLGFGGTNHPVKYLTDFVINFAKPIETFKWALSMPLLKQRLKQRQISEFMERNALNTESVIPELTKRYHNTKLSGVALIGDLVGWLSDKMGNVGMAFQASGDFMANAFALKPLYDEYVRDSNADTLEGKKKEAEERIMEFMVNRQSSENQAVKPYAVRRARNANPNLGPMLYTYTNELTQKGGQIGRDMVEYKHGDITLSKAARDILAITASNVLYACIQSGYVYAILSAAAKGQEEIEDDVWEEVLNGFQVEAISTIAGMISPYSNLGVSAIGEEVFLNRNYGIEIPVISQIIDLFSYIRKEEFVEAITLGMSAAGLGIGLPQFLNAIEGGIRAGDESLSEKEQEAGILQLLGRSENTSRKLVGLKRKKKRLEKNEDDD